MRIVQVINQNIASNNSIFEGTSDRRIPRNNEIIDKIYYKMGRMMAGSILHGCCPPVFMVKSIVQYFLKGLDDFQPVLEDVCDDATRNVLQQVICHLCGMHNTCNLLKLYFQLQDSFDDKHLQQLLDETCLSCRYECGITKPSDCYTLADKDYILKTLTIYYVILVRQGALDQLLECLHSYGVQRLLKMHHEQEILSTNPAKLTTSS